MLLRMMFVELMSKYKTRRTQEEKSEERQIADLPFSFLMCSVLCKKYKGGEILVINSHVILQTAPQERSSSRFCSSSVYML